MAKRSSQTFAKRQKELARKERQAEKARKRMERKQRRADGLPPYGDIEPGAETLPQDESQPDTAQPDAEATPDAAPDATQQP